MVICGEVNFTTSTQRWLIGFLELPRALRTCPDDMQKGRHRALKFPLEASKFHIKAFDDQ